MDLSLSREKSCTIVYLKIFYFIILFILLACLIVPQYANGNFNISFSWMSGRLANLIRIGFNGFGLEALLLLRNV
jgi:hypothetical protein